VSAIVVATAGWSIPAATRDAFPGAGTHLMRYARVLPGVEINSTFYRPHRPQTFARWSDSVPADFRFAVKLPREITHQRKLTNISAPLARFLSEISHLGPKLGPVLVQLPPSLAFNESEALGFFDLLRAQFSGDIAVEPRHASWFTPKVDAGFDERRIARVKADPAQPPGAAAPGGWRGFVYYRLHGAPRTYWSNYSNDELEKVASELAAHRAAGARVWCVFDNTAQGFAATNALALKTLLG
jgi:uncharacterized protein YecE (DUF72 family)